MGEKEKEKETKKGGKKEKEQNQTKSQKEKGTSSTLSNVIYSLRRPDIRPHQTSHHRNGVDLTITDQSPTFVGATFLLDSIRMCWPESDHVVEDQESIDKGTEEEENSAHNITNNMF